VVRRWLRLLLVRGERASSDDAPTPRPLPSALPEDHDDGLS
jgi:hypothetical protein